MKYAAINGKRILSSPGATAWCPNCGEPVRAKCGTKRSWHWAHEAKINCDPWWENETQWHRDWKDQFPQQWQEIIHYDDAGEKHIADVKTSSGFVLEFQHSVISPKEICAREHFYQNMCWIVDGRRTEKDFLKFENNTFTKDWKNWQFPAAYRVPPINRIIPDRWLNCTKPVFFDWGKVKSEYWIEDIESDLVGILPNTNILFSVTRDEFKVMVGNNAAMEKSFTEFLSERLQIKSRF